jgi:hypothetical protein
VPGTSITCSDGFGTRNDPQTVSPKHWPCARPRAAVRAGMSGWTLCRPPPSPAPRGLRPPRPGPLAAPSGHGPSRSALIAPLLRLIALRWRVALLRGGASKGFSVSRVREPGTAERDSVCLRPDGDRRMPGTRPSCPWRQTSPARPPLRDFTYSANSTILGPRSAREGAHRRRVAFGARGCGARRPPVAFRTPVCRSSFSGAWHPPRAARRTSLGSSALGDARRWPKPLECGDQPWSPEGGELERRRSRTRQRPVPRRTMLRSTARAGAVTARRRSPLLGRGRLGGHEIHGTRDGDAGHASSLVDPAVAVEDLELVGVQGP